MWHIAKRELYDNLNSLRFALATVLLLGLMLTNAAVYLHEQPKRIQRYNTSISESLTDLTARADSLYTLAQEGPGLLYKKPSSLRFCAEGGETFFPNVVGGAFLWSISGGLRGFWRLNYPSATPNLKDIRPKVTEVDWAFIIGYVLSLIALLFTFDAVSGEREHGTLRLMLANPIPRHTVLIGKFLGGINQYRYPADACGIDEPITDFYIKCCATRSRCLGTFRYHFFYCYFVHQPISCVRALGFCPCFAKRGISCAPLVDLGYLCHLCTEYTRLYCRRVFVTDVH